MQATKIANRLRLVLMLIALLTFGMSGALASTSQANNQSAESVVMDCSGDDCGCGMAAQQCVAECHADPTVNQFACVRGCTKQNIACSIACCAP